MAMEEDCRGPRDGSQIGQRTFLRDRIMGHDYLVGDYFGNAKKKKNRGSAR